MLTRLELTPALRAAIDAVCAAEAIHCPGLESASVIELPKLALADALLAALQAQTLERLPARAVRSLRVGRRDRRRRA